MTKLHFSNLILVAENGLAFKDSKKRICDRDLWREMRDEDGGSGYGSVREGREE